MVHVLQINRFGVESNKESDSAEKNGKVARADTDTGKAFKMNTGETPETDTVGADVGSAVGSADEITRRHPLKPIAE